MKKTIALRCGAAFVSSASFIALASPAYADCTVTTGGPPLTVDCIATTTTDTTATTDPWSDRQFTFGAAGGTDVTINGAIDGFGLAITQNTPDTSLLTVTNNGSIQVDTLNTPGAGGNGALSITSLGAPVTYSGSGTISNLGSGDGLRIVADLASSPVAIDVNAGGAITSTDGVGAFIYAPSSGSTIDATFTSISTDGFYGIYTTTSDGAQVLNTGTVTAGTYGVFSASDTGALTTNVTGTISAPSAGVVLLSDSGDATVNVTGGDIASAGGTAIVLQTTGAQAVNISAGRTVSGTVGVFSNLSGGTLTVNNSGTLSGTSYAVYSNAQTNLTNAVGGTVDGVMVLSDLADTVTNDGTMTLADGSNFRAGNDTLTNNGTATLAGSVAFGDGDDTIANGAGDTLTISGTTDLGLGNDVVTNAATGTIDVTGSLLGGDGNDAITNAGTLTVASGGTVDLGLGDDSLSNTGTLTVTGTLLGGDGIDTLSNAAGATTTINGTADLGLGDDVITNAGTFTVASGATFTTGDGNDTLTNSGTYTVAGSQDFGAGTDTVSNTGTINVTGSGSLANLESFTNAAAGTVNFASGSSLAAAGATSFTNAGRLNAEAGPVGITVPTFTNAATGVIDMQDGANGDVTTITGNYVGTAGSRVLIDANADLSASDRLVVSGNISGTSTLGVAYLGTASTFNPTGALVVDGGGTTAAGSFVLDPASVNNGLLTYGLDLRGADYYLTSNFNVGVTGLAPIARMGSDMWYQSFDAYHDGIAGRHGYRDEERSPFGVWANLYWSRDKWGDTNATTTLFGQNLTYSSEIENHRRGAQGGVDIGFGGFTVGITGGYAHNKANNGTFAQYDLEGYNYGAYALFGSEAGLYGGVMYKRDDYDVSYYDATRGFSQKMSNAHSDGWDGELGFRTTGETMRFDLNAGLSWVKAKIDPVTLYGATFSYDDAESMRGRLGARIIFPQAWGAFFGVKAFHEFKKDNEALFITSGTNTGTLLPDPRGTTFRAEAGLGGAAKGGPVLTVWGDFGDSKGLGVRAGFRF